MTTSPAAKPSLRLEDQRFLTGRGRYVDDRPGDGQLHARFVRADLAHAEITAIDVSDAAAMPGVVGVWTGADLVADGIGPMPCSVVAATVEPIIIPPHHALAVDRVRYVGEPVVLIVAESAEAAADAAEAVMVEYDDLPTVMDVADAEEEDAPQIWPQAPGNCAYRFVKGDPDAVATAMETAAHVIELELDNQRVSAFPLEPRAAVAEYDATSDCFTMDLTGQGLHGIRADLAGPVFGLPAERFHLRADDVGGGFGLKNFLFAEWVCLLWAARRTGKPVRWLATTGEELAAAVHGRAVTSKARLALDAEGGFLALDVDMVADMGAYLSSGGPNAATNAASTAMGGVYRIPAIHMRSRGVFTNTAPVDAYRGAGKPEANFVIERLIDAAARRCGFDPVDLRRRNIVDTFPYPKALGAVLDCGRFRGNLDDAVALADRDGFEARRAEAAKSGKLLGLGIACFLESSRGAPQEEVEVRFAADGKVELATGTESNGQGHETVFTRLASERLGLPMDAFRYVQADTFATRTGAGHGGARTMHMGAGTLMLAMDAMLEKAIPLAARLLQADPETVTFSEGRFRAGTDDRSVSLLEVAAAARSSDASPETGEKGLDTAVFRRDVPFTFPGGCHVAEVEIERETGQVTLTRYIAVDDYGSVYDPQLTEGQLHGGVVQGIGQALGERIAYDPDSGQLLSGSMMDYALPRAVDLPMFDVTFAGDPTTANPLGAKGVGQAGCIAAPPAVINAVVDALAPLGVDHIQMPATSERVWKAIAARG
ncbi:xanthine dehydrogenase family protein molybdopterin-binding subunit [Thalassobaculum sp.]|uniref:xanthine dehydrogenase family protein molybdopterin-binding subunit n=1 Tax=Thalassobaculum sp. TaxID=2022740 RepID=UPI003B5C205C